MQACKRHRRSRVLTAIASGLVSTCSSATSTLVAGGDTDESLASNILENSYDVITTSLLEYHCCSARDLRAWDSVSWLSMASGRLLHQLLPPRSLIILDFKSKPCSGLCS